MNVYGYDLGFEVVVLLLYLNEVKHFFYPFGTTVYGQADVYGK